MSSFNELQKRLHFLNKQVDVLFQRVEQMHKAIGEIDKDFWGASDMMDQFDDRIREIKEEVRRIDKGKRKKQVELIRKNLAAVTQQLRDQREPQPYIPPEQMEAFQEFLTKLNGRFK